MGDWQSRNALELLRSFLLPIWLTIGALPFIAALSLYDTYRLAFAFTGMGTDGGKAPWTAKLALITTFGLGTRELRRFRAYWPRQRAQAKGVRNGRRVIRDFRADLRAKEAAKRKEAEDLVRHAGMAGTDSEGLQLDRREFKETTNALEWLSTCHMGWYRNRAGSRYPADLMKIFQPGHTRGLPDDHGITMKVRKDGKAWFAWRRTITGWIFAIGAAGPPPDQWFYDGPEPPRGYPGSDPVWGSRPFERSRNW